MKEVTRFKNLDLAFDTNKNDKLYSIVGFKKLNPDAIIPKKAKHGDAGSDLHSIEDVIIPSHGIAIVKTGLAWESRGMELQVRPRSGLAAKHMITVLNTPGTVDSGYRNEIGVILINHSDDSYKVSKGDRIAQAVFAPIYAVGVVELDVLSDSDRNLGGYGSTGK